MDVFRRIFCFYLLATSAFVWHLFIYKCHFIFILLEDIRYLALPFFIPHFAM